MNADQLRQALINHEAMTNYLPDPAFFKDRSAVLAAARFALKVWEGDEQIIERAAKAIWRSDTLDVNEHRWDGLQGWQRGDYIWQARAVFAAIVGEDER